MIKSEIRAGSLYTRAGQRKYLTSAERSRFLTAALSSPRAELRTLCLTLLYTGCRISEALAITPRAIERQAGFIAIRSLKKRKRVMVIRDASRLNGCTLASTRVGPARQPPLPETLRRDRLIPE